MADDLFFSVLIKAQGGEYDLSFDLTSLNIEEDTSGPDRLTVDMSDPYKVYSHAFQEGMDVEVDLGTVEDHSLIFRGRIYRVESSFPQNGIPTLSLSAHDSSMKMGLRRRNRVWTDLKLSEIVEQIATVDHGFQDVDIQLQGDPLFEGNGIRQQDETDLAFLLRLAGEYGCEMYVTAGPEDDTFHFIAQYIIMTTPPEVTLYHARCDVDYRLLSFQPTSDVSDIQLPRVFSGIDYETGEPSEIATAQAEEVAKTEDTFFDENMSEFRKRYPRQAQQLSQLITAAPTVQQTIRKELGTVERQPSIGFTTPDNLRQRAENQYSTSILGMRANGSTPGNKNLRAQTSVGIEDVGARFSGTWYLSQVRHTLNNQGYQTNFQCRR